MPTPSVFTPITPALAAPRRRLICSVTGFEKTGKTDWSLRGAVHLPGRVFYICWDRNGEETAKKITRETGREIEKVVLGVSDKSFTPADTRRNWEIFRAAVKEVCQEKAGTVVFDTGTEAYDGLRLYLFGKLAGVLQIKYQDVNAEFNEVFNDLYDSSLSAIWCHKLAPEFIQTGAEAASRRATGNYRLDGWGNMPFAVQANFETVYYPDAKGERFWVHCKQNTMNMRMSGLTFPASLFSFAEMLSATYDEGALDVIAAMAGVEMQP